MAEKERNQVKVASGGVGGVTVLRLHFETSEDDKNATVLNGRGKIINEPEDSQRG